VDLFDRVHAILTEADAATVKPSESIKPFKPHIRMVNGTPHMSSADFRKLPGLKLKSGSQFTFDKSQPSPVSATKPEAAAPSAPTVQASAGAPTKGSDSEGEFTLKPNGFKEYKDFTQAPSGLKIYRYDSRANIAAVKARQAAERAAATSSPVSPKRDINAWVHVGQSRPTSSPKPERIGTAPSQEPQVGHPAPQPKAKTSLWKRFTSDEKPETGKVAPKAISAQPKPSAPEVRPASAEPDESLTSMWKQYARNHSAPRYTAGIHLQNNELFHKVSDKYGLDTAKAMHGYAEAMRRGKMFDVARKFGVDENMDEAIGASIPSAFKAPKPPGMGVRAIMPGPGLRMKTTASSTGAAPRSTLAALRMKTSAPTTARSPAIKIGQTLKPKLTAPTTKASVSSFKQAKAQTGNIGEEDLTEAGRVKNLNKHSVKHGIFSSRMRRYRNRIDVNPTDREGRPDAGEGDDRGHDERNSANESVVLAENGQYYGQFLLAIARHGK
jgi:hypothetical protein